jgi:tryptophan-rich sensory protein
MNRDDRSTWRQVAALLGFVLICFAAAGLGSLATASSVNDWYRTLERPTWSPPDWVFGPVWTTLYLMMAVAAWLVWRQKGWSAAVRPLSWFGAQLALNVLWSVLFFGMQRPGWAFAEVLLLWLAIAGTIASFWPRSRPASLLMTPYLAWTSFAAVLNFLIWRLNA